MARGRSRSRKKRSKKKRSPSKRPKAGAVTPRIKVRTGPVQLWLPLQMPLGLLGGVALAPSMQDVVEDAAEAAPAQHGGMAEQASLFD